MAQSKRILFIAGEVTPFAQVSDMADLVRTLPENLQDTGDYEVRITMPRYGTINERSNRLHEVIRLSGTEVSMGDTTETLTVKVASLPDVRLQVYFMDHDKYFGRKAIATDDDGQAFDDNAHRALFYTRSVLETIRKLRWGPDVIHGFGWTAGLVPLLMNTEYTGDDVLGNAKVVYTPDAVDGTTTISPDFASAMQLQSNGEVNGQSLVDLGTAQADATIYPPFLAANDGAPQFDDDAGTRADQLVSLYDEMLSEVPA
jgi:starch synthase